MASSINASTTAGVVTTADTSGVLNIQTAGVTAISIDASQAVSFTNSPTVTGGTANGVAYLNGSKVLTTGSALVFDGTNFGVNVTPSAWWGSGNAIEMGGKSFNYIALNGGTNGFVYTNAYYNGTNNIYKNTGFANYYAMTGGQHQWFNSPSGTAGNAITFTQAMTLNASGNYFLGTTTNGINTSRASIFNDSSNNTATFAAQSGTAASTANMVCYHGSASGATAATQIAFLNGAASQVGSITSTGSVTAYVTASDYRLKENIIPMTGALDKVTQLKPVTYKWKLDGSDGQGFIAHELSEICQDAVHGNKDAMDAEGNPIYQGIDTSFLVATLTAAIQEMKAIIDTQASTITTLTDRITALENK